MALVALTAGAFVFQNAAETLNLLPVYRDFALSMGGLRHGCFWQLITFQFLHLRLADGGIFHLLGNLFAVFILGNAVERVLGPVRLLGLYLLSGTVGGLLQVTAGCLAPEQFGSAVVGASAGACGLLAAYATLFPRQPLTVFFLPVSIRPDILLALAVVVTVLGLFLPSGHVAHCAHLGGIFTGFMLVRVLTRRKPAFALTCR